MFLFVLCWLLITLWSTNIAKECNVIDFGAKGDGKTDDTKALQKAIDSCFDNNSNQINTVLFPSNLIFLTLPLVINYNNTHLSLGSNTQINAHSDLNLWPVIDNDYQTFITVNSSRKHFHNIFISGSGSKSSIINGNGEIFWEIYRNNTIKYSRPHLINIYNVQNLQIYGFTGMNAGSWHISVNGCDNVTIYDINISSPNEYIAPNTDGIDIASSNVHVYDCYASNGDDSFTLKSGANNVLFENSTAAYPGNGIVIGTGGDIQNIMFRNMICDQTQHGIHLKAKDSQIGVQNNITFYNITFINVLAAIDLSNFNQSMSGNVQLESNVSIQNILMENISGTYEEYAGHLNCEKSNPCYNLTFKDIDLMPVFTQAKGWQCSDNVYGIATNVNPQLTCLNKH